MDDLPFRISRLICFLKPNAPLCGCTAPLHNANIAVAFFVDVKRKVHAIPTSWPILKVVRDIDTQAPIHLQTTTNQLSVS